MGNIMSNSFEQIQRLLEEQVAASSVPAEDPSVTKKRHKDLFMANCDAVEKIRRMDGVEFRAGCLSFVWSESGDPDLGDAPDLPLVRGATEEIDLESIQLPASTGSDNLKDLILSQCHENKILIDTSTRMVPCTTLEFVIQGKPDERDMDCTAPMHAYCTPIYNNDQATMQRALVLNILINSASDVRVDNIILRAHTSMSLNNRQGSTGLNSSIKIIEVTESTAKEVEKKEPGSLSQDGNTCITVVINYNNLTCDPRVPTREKSSIRIVQQSTGGNKTQPQAHAVMGTGSSLKDQTIRVYEKGLHIATGIQVYVSSPRVINTQRKELTRDSARQEFEQMQQSTKELDEQFAPYKTISFKGLQASVNDRINSYGLDCRKVPLIEEALLQLGQSKEWPDSYQLTSCGTEHMIMEGAFTPYGASRLVEQTKQRYGADFCHLDENGQIRYKLKALAKALPDIMTSIEESLSKESTLRACKKYSDNRPSLYSEFMRKIDRMMTAKGISIHKTSGTEIVLLAMTGSRIRPEWAKLSPGKTIAESLLDMHLHIDVAPELAGEIADKFTERFPEFPESVRLLHTGEEGQEFCNISFQGELLCNNLFLASFRETLNQLAENEPLLIESLRMASGSPGKPAMQHAETLHQLATAHRNGHSSEQALADSLVSLAHTSTNHSATLSDRRLAGAKAREALTLFSKSLSADDRAAFRQGEKREIKTTIAALSGM